jgi:hypothetical protein
VLTILHALITPEDILPIVSFIVVLGAKYSKLRFRNMSHRIKYIAAVFALFFNDLFNICCPGFCCTVLCKALACSDPLHVVLYVARYDKIPDTAMSLVSKGVLYFWKRGKA